MSTLTIAIDDHLAHSILMAKCCYFSDHVLPADGEKHTFRMANYDRLDRLYVLIRATLDMPADPSIA